MRCAIKQHEKHKTTMNENELNQVGADGNEDLTAAYMLGKYDGRNSRCSASDSYDERDKKYIKKLIDDVAEEGWRLGKDAAGERDVQQAKDRLMLFILNHNNKCADDEAQRSR